MKPISSFHYSENINNSYRQTSEIRGGKATFAWGMKHCLSMYTTKWFNFKEHFEYVKLNWIDIVHSTSMSIGLVHMVVSKIEYLGWYFRVQKLGPGQEHNQVLGTLLSCFTYYLLIFVVYYVSTYYMCSMYFGKVSRKGHKINYFYIMNYFSELGLHSTTVFPEHFVT